MTLKQLIAFGSLFLVILGLILYIVFRNPVVTIDNSDKNAYRDSLKVLWDINSAKDSVIAKRNRSMDSLELITKSNNQHYHESIKLIYNPNIPARSLDSIVRSIVFPKTH